MGAVREVKVSDVWIRARHVGGAVRSPQLNALLDVLKAHVANITTSSFRSLHVDSAFPQQLHVSDGDIFYSTTAR